MAPEPEDDIKDEKNPKPLDEDDIALLKTYVRYSLLFKLLFYLRFMELYVFSFYLLCIEIWVFKID